MSLNIQGLQKTTLLDYPGHVAATIFLGGCNFKCVFCHNMDIVLTNGAGEADEVPTNSNSVNISPYSENEVLSFLSKRAGILDGICITGGEPTLYKELPDFIRKVKALNLLVKLDTNGTNPEMIKYLLDNNLIDYIAMDIKSSLEKYDEICGFIAGEIDTTPKSSICINKDALKESVHLILKSNISYEFRTTVVKEYHDAKTMIEIGKLINGADNYFLQPFVDSDSVPNHNLHSWDFDTLNTFVEALRPYVKNVSIRSEE